MLSPKPMGFRKTSCWIQAETADLAQSKFVEITASHLYRDHLITTPPPPHCLKMANLCLITLMLWEASLLSKDSKPPNSLALTTSPSPPPPKSQRYPTHPLCTCPAPIAVFPLGCWYLTLQTGPMTNMLVCKHNQTCSSSHRHLPVYFRKLFAQMAAGC